MRILLLLLIIPARLFSQNVTVPSTLYFADIKLNLNSSARAVIQKDVDNLTNSPKYFEILAEKARTYFPIVEEVFRNENVPEDFKYLIIQESSITADAVSSSNAVGYWQMKDFTAIELGLIVNKDIDERKSIVAATVGAARYFKKSNENFNNWLNALQSYQMGVGGAMRLLGDKDFGKKTMDITDKTYWYVRKFLAYKVAFENINNKEATIKVTTVKNMGGKNLKDLSYEHNIDIEIVKDYNKWVLKNNIPINGVNILVLPSEYAQNSIQLSDQPEIIPIKTITTKSNDGSDLFPRINKSKHSKHKYIIGINNIPGIIAGNTDTMESMALKGELSKKKFVSFNDLSPSDKIKNGQVYYLKKKKNKAKTYYHTIKEGENLWTISQKYGIKLDKLKEKNRIIIVTKAETKPGRVLWLRHIRPEDTPIEYKPVEVSTQNDIPSAITPIPIKESSMTENITLPELEETKKITENADSIEIEEVASVIPTEISESKNKIILTVKKGETLYSIGNKYKVEITDIIQWNNLEIGQPLSIGQIITIYTESDHKGFSTYYVKEGDTMYSISSKFSVTISEIMKWNNKENTNLVLGEKILIKN